MCIQCRNTNRPFVVEKRVLSDEWPSFEMFDLFYCVFLQYTNLVTIFSSSSFCLFGESAEFVFHFCFYFFTGGYVFVESLYSATTL